VLTRAPPGFILWQGQREHAADAVLAIKQNLAMQQRGQLAAQVQAQAGALELPQLAASSCEKAWNSAARCSLPMPMPVSLTLMVAQSRAPPPPRQPHQHRPCW
jgi:hypothetical protein